MSQNQARDLSPLIAIHDAYESVKKFAAKATGYALVIVAGSASSFIPGDIVSSITAPSKQVPIELKEATQISPIFEEKKAQKTSSFKATPSLQKSR